MDGVLIPSDWNCCSCALHSCTSTSQILRFLFKKLVQRFVLPTLFWLVVEPPLWKMSSSIGMIIPNIWENKNVPNHQPVFLFWEDLGRTSYFHLLNRKVLLETEDQETQRPFGKTGRTTWGVSKLKGLRNPQVTKSYKYVYINMITH